MFALSITSTDVKDHERHISFAGVVLMIKGHIIELCPWLTVRYFIESP